MDSSLIPSRLGNRSTQDREDILTVLNQSLFCTVSCVHDSKPFAIPTGFCIYKDKLLLHGSVKSHFLELLMGAGEVCITTFIFDALVLAASAFHHSVNYRSIVLFAKPIEITDYEEKVEAMKTYTEKYVPGRWDSLRPINKGEVKATWIIACDLNKASLKYRTGPPSFEMADSKLGIWTGLVTANNKWGSAIPDPNMDPAIIIPEHVQNLINRTA